MSNKPQHIIISRTDNIGDVVLTLPMAAIIKQQWPQCKVSFLARDYVKDVISACPNVDAFISWDRLQQLSTAEAAKNLTSADTIIHVAPNKHIAKLAKHAGIQNRIGSSHRIYHWCTCNQRVNFSRKKSQLHEAQLNLALFKPLGLPTQASLAELTQLTHLNKNTALAPAVTELLQTGKKNIVLHPLSNGNSKEWPLTKFAELITLLADDSYHVIITGTPNEQERLADFLQQHPQVTNAVGKLSLHDFIDLLGAVDGVVVNSTGPLHIAAALGQQVLGLFPPDKGKDPGRWGPLGKNASYLLAREDVNGQQQTATNCMQTISAASVKTVIESWS